MTPAQEKALAAAAASAGATRVERIGLTLTHVIFGDMACHEPARFSGEASALAVGAPSAVLVTADWLLECHRRGALVPPQHPREVGGARRRPGLALRALARPAHPRQRRRARALCPLSHSFAAASARGGAPRRAPPRRASRAAAPAPRLSEALAVLCRASSGRGPERPAEQLREPRALAVERELPQGCARRSARLRAREALRRQRVRLVRGEGRGVSN